MKLRCIIGIINFWNEYKTLYNIFIMEESSNIQKANEKIIEDENENETTSRNNVIDPDMKSDNMKDLKSLDFNSADDVRYKII